MAAPLKTEVIKWLSGKIDEVGFAPMDRFDDAPDEHHPSSILEGARTVVVFGKLIPRGILRSPRYGPHFVHRTYHSVYPYLDELGMELSNMLEKRGHLAVPIPGYAPMVFHGYEPWGILSLKHAAVNAGLGAFGKSGFVLHSKHGSMLRFGAVVTTAEIKGDKVNDNLPCPPKCRACMKACPAGAFDEDGNFQKLKCLGYAIKHAIYPVALKTQGHLDNVEMIANTAGFNYWIGCSECLKVCPKNKIVGS